MIFVTDAVGHWIHASKECIALTGQTVDDALGAGWLARVHVDDRSIVSEILDSAIRSAAEFSVRYRLLRPDGTPRWVGAGGVPSFGMEDNRFIGYLGSITELAAGATDTLTAYGNVGRFLPPSPHPDTMPSGDLDLIADHLLIAHSLIENDGVKSALPGLRAALFEVGRALAARARRDPRSLN